MRNIFRRNRTDKSDFNHYGFVCNRDECNCKDDLQPSTESNSDGVTVGHGETSPYVIFSIEGWDAAIADELRAAVAVEANGENSAGRATPMVSREFIKDRISDLEDEISELYEMLNAMEVPEDISDIFAEMVDHEDYSIIGDPVEYSRSDDELVAIARVIFQGDPYCVIARATEGIEEDVERHFVYIHLADDFAFSLADTIYATK